MAMEDPSAYRERRPPAELTDHVTNLWVREVPDAAPATVRVLPDGRADLMWLQDGNTVTTLVAGPDSRVQFAELEAGSRMAGLRFAPGVAAMVLGVPLDELRDQRVPLSELWGPAAIELAEQAATSDDPESMLAAAARRRITDPPDHSASYIATTLERSSGPGVVARVADELGLSERQLLRRCLSAFGYGPKTLQ
jgi:hypothetical protein